MISPARICPFVLLPLATALACAPSPLPEIPAAKTVDSSTRESPDPRETMVPIAKGPFFFGVTERQFQFFLSQSMINFPRMLERMRERLIIPPREQFEGEFFIGRFEVTNREFKEFLDSTSYRPSHSRDFLRHWEDNRYPDWAADFPVVWVSHADASAYCRWLGAQLPTETQWEKAARGASDSRAFPWGDTRPSPRMVNYASEQAEPAGDRPQDVSPFQVYDLAGNVSEWTRSLLAPGQADEFVLRGGSFQENSRYTLVGIRLRSAKRNERFEDVGFRCVAE